jgi:hypothetical protein
MPSVLPVITAQTFASRAYHSIPNPNRLAKNEVQINFNNLIVIKNIRKIIKIRPKISQNILFP